MFSRSGLNKIIINESLGGPDKDLSKKTLNMNNFKDNSNRVFTRSIVV